MESNDLRITKQRLTSLASDPSPKIHEFARDNARELLIEIIEAERILSCDTKRIALIGQVGNGKTTLLTMLSGLYVGETPTEKSQIKKRGVLPTGTGRTTACEVRVTHDTQHDGILIKLHGLSVNEMEYEIESFAEDYWSMHHQDAQTRIDPGEPPTPEERLRQIRGLTKLPKNVDHPDEDPLLLLMNKLGSIDEFVWALQQRALLDERTKTTWSYGSSSEQLEACRELLRKINDGLQDDAALPKSLKLTIGLHKSLLGDLEWLDTLGLDGSAADGRSDLQQIKKDESTLMILCSGFKGAPDEGVRNPLTNLQPDLERTVVLILDHGLAEDVNDADGDRERGKRLKLDECCNRLTADGFQSIVSHKHVIVHDALKDNNSELLDRIKAVIASLRERRMNVLSERVRDGDTFLEQYEKDPSSFPQIQIDTSLRETFDAHANQTRTQPIHQIIAERITNERYAVRVFAMVRRAGKHQGMDLFELIKAPSGRSFRSFCKPTANALTGAMKTAQHKNSDARIVFHIAQRTRRIDADLARGEAKFADGVRDCLLQHLPAHRDPGNIWDLCAKEWGNGPGFKSRVIKIIEGWCNNNKQVQQEIDGLAFQELKQVRLP